MTRWEEQLRRAVKSGRLTDVDKAGIETALDYYFETKPRVILERYCERHQDGVDARLAGVDRCPTWHWDR